MQNITKPVPWLDALAFGSLALGVLSLAFFWMPGVGVCLSAAGLLIGFFGWITASQNGDASAFYLGVGALVSTVTLVFNLLLATHSLAQFF
jgi:hypothetical protein